MGSLTTEIPASAAGTKSKRGGSDNLENEAIGLDVSVRVHGSQVAAVVLDTTEHVEPFEEDCSTMIVFPRGAVVKLRARVRTGHAVVLTNVATKQTALCRIIQVNSTANAVNYVKLEFSQPEPGFWGVHFPSDENGDLPQRRDEHAVANSADRKNPATETLDAPAPKPERSNSPLTAAKTQPLPEPAWPRTNARPLTPEEEPVKPAPLQVSYGGSANADIKTEVVPLAAAPAKSAPAAPKHQASFAPPPQREASSATEAPIFDSLSTGEEVFGRESPTPLTDETAILKADRKTAQAFGRSLDPASLLQSVEIPKRRTGLKIALSAAAVIIIGAGAAFYVKQYRGNAHLNAQAAAVTPIEQKTAAPASSGTSAETTRSQAAAPPETVAAPATSSTQQAAIPSPPERDTVVVTPVHTAARNTAPQSHPTISTGLANIYAGDLAARPQASRRSSAPVQAPVPAIGGTPANFGAAAGSASLGSLVSGASGDNSVSLPKPAEPKPLVRGGVVTAPKLLHAVQPAYPPLANTNRVEGDVQLQALIDQNGKVISAKVISGPVLLRNAAMDAVRQWRYSPALLDGKPISMEYKVTVSFRLNQ